VFRWFVAGLGAACLICAAVLSGYALLGAKPPYCADGICDESSSAATAMAWAVAVAAVLIGAMFAWQWRSRLRTSSDMPGWLHFAAAVAAVGLAFGYLAAGMASEDFGASGQRVWLVRVAIVFAFAGCVVVVVCQPPARRGRGRLAAALAAVAAVGLVAALTTAAWRDERTTLDATTAAPVDIPPQPASFGQERFRLSLPYFKPRIQAAGAGFIIWTTYWSKDFSAPDLMAFDAAGKERWHYSRTGPRQDLDRVETYDNGRVVVLGFSGGEMVGLDAVTGEELWTSSDEDMWHALDINEGGSYVLFAVRDEDHWTGFNARTGRQTWRIPSPAGCRGTDRLNTLSNLNEPYIVRPADTESRLVTVIDCSTADRINLRVLVNDPADGAQLADLPVPEADGLPRDTWRILGVDYAFGNRVPITLEKECAERPPTGPCTREGEERHMLLNFVTGQVQSLPPAWLDPSYQLRGDFVLDPIRSGTSTARRNSEDPADLMNADLTLRCRYMRPNDARGVVRWLNDQLVFQSGQLIRAISRDDCRIEVDTPWPVTAEKEIEARFTTAVPGATLAVQTNEDYTVDIVGFAP
jgi:hypothetical protein